MTFRKKAILVLLIILGLFVINYIFAWYKAYSLSDRFFKDAEASYEQGRYLDALIGYSQVDKATNRHLDYGGFYQVQKIWKNSYAQPQPEIFLISNQRIHEIIYQHMTIQDGEEFVQIFTGQNNYLFPDVYLHLGELYQSSGDNQSAKEIYRDCLSLFPDRPDIAQVAKDHLTELGVTIP